VAFNPRNQLTVTRAISGAKPPIAAGRKPLLEMAKRKGWRRFADGVAASGRLARARRYRNKEHLRFVAQQPCLLCARKPSDRPHLGFVQPRALGRKASNDFAVPLCRSHHRAVHRAGGEEACGRKPASTRRGGRRMIARPKPNEQSRQIRSERRCMWGQSFADFLTRRWAPSALLQRQASMVPSAVANRTAIA
jgi:hypothetical protein